MQLDDGSQQEPSPDTHPPDIMDAETQIIEHLHAPSQRKDAPAEPHEARTQTRSASDVGDSRHQAEPVLQPPRRATRQVRGRRRQT